MSEQSIPQHGSLKRRGLPTITSTMRGVLLRLRDARQAGDALVALPDVGLPTIQALEDRDWIVASPPHLGETRYEITGRGLQALKVYLPAVKRRDGICPRCGERPRSTTKSGKLAPYCRECEAHKCKRKRLLGLGKKNPNALCPRCKERTRYVAPSGEANSYCRRCKNAKNQTRHRHQRLELLKRIRAGEHIPCSREGCDQPRLVYGESVQEYCREHYTTWRHEYRRRAAHKEL